MDATDSGSEEPSEKMFELTPSSHGRQRKKNPKYLDYETDENYEQNSQQKQHRKTPTRKSLGAGAASGEAPKKRGRPRKDAKKVLDGDQKASEQTPQQPDGDNSQEIPKKMERTKKTPSKRTPAKKESSIKDGPPTGKDGVVVDTLQQENGTPKPKRKYVRRQKIQEVVPSKEPACQEEPVEETTPGGRPRRGAAKAALKYLHNLAKEVFSPNHDEQGDQPDATSERTSPDPYSGLKGTKGRKARSKVRKRKRRGDDSDCSEDEDFVPNAEEEQAEDMEDEEGEMEDFDLDSDSGSNGRTPSAFRYNRSIQGQGRCHGKAPNGLPNSSMLPVWEAMDTAKKFREEHYSSWVFPEWVPSVTDWRLLPESDLEKYLPRDLHSANFKVFRERVRGEETPLQNLSRFGSMPAHPERWDMLLNAGGPMWAMEWCPTPDGATTTQYIALACHQGMDDQHFIKEMYTEPGLIQLWDVGNLQFDHRPESQPALAYGLAQDKGFIWHLKWCPAGAWELPSCSRKAPFLPRLGLLAVATSSGVVTIYSLPHPDALHSSKRLPETGEANQQLCVYQAEGVLTLKLGSLKSLHHEQSGQILSMDWAPEKPHNIMAIGFYDGVVGLWDLCAKSALLLVRETDQPSTLMPYRCFLAHDNAVRALSFCPASRYLLVTGGDDRMVKTWDLRRLYEPITVQKRNLTTDVCWPLNAPGVFIAQEVAYAGHTVHGVHYYDHCMRSIFPIPRTATLWSLSFSDWLNGLLTSDTQGEVIFALLPHIYADPQYSKRTIDKRFPVYITDVVPYGAEDDGSEEEEEGLGGVEKRGGAAEGPAAASDGNDESSSEKGSEGGRGGKDEGPTVRDQTYREAVKKYYLHLKDIDMRTFINQKQVTWKHMRDTEVKRKLNLDVMPMAALHKVCFNPNMSCHTWLASGGRAGLVRLHCMQSLISSHSKKLIREAEAPFNALYSPQDHTQAADDTTDTADDTADTADDTADTANTADTVDDTADTADNQL
ncbi:general transcription factor 3C polypeptide 2 [Genypterus blacodes]|uniref:general transcription factor 3C polypeptide 2 n=1 Tax=Genypterus blacodes TaxID=154954 RepID=UPI003F770347